MDNLWFESKYMINIYLGEFDHDLTATDPWESSLRHHSQMALIHVNEIL